MTTITTWRPAAEGPGDMRSLDGGACGATDVRAGAVDLLVAATAELSGRTVPHYDADFETVAGATGQQTRWVAPPGTV